MAARASARRGIPAAVSTRGVNAALGAGMTFAGTVLVGTIGGWWAATASGQSWWFIVGFFGGVFLGGFSAVRLLLRASK